MSETLQMQGAERCAKVTRDDKTGTVLVQWEPGNCTRYQVLLQPLPPGIAAAMGMEPGTPTVLATWYIPGERGTSYPFRSDPGGVYHYAYIEEKMCRRDQRVDASEIARILATVLLGRAGLCTDSRGNYVR